MTNGRVANPYRLLGRALFWAVIARELWVRVLGVREVWPYDSPWHSLGRAEAHRAHPSQRRKGGCIPWVFPRKCMGGQLLTTRLVSAIRDTTVDSGVTGGEGHDSGPVPEWRAVRQVVITSKSGGVGGVGGGKNCGKTHGKCKNERKGKCG